MAQIASELADATPERLAQAGRDHAKGEGDSIRRISDWPLARLFSRQQLCPETASATRRSMTRVKRWREAGMARDSPAIRALTSTALAAAPAIRRT